VSVIELIILAAGLAMDAFAVSICKGLSVRKYRKGQSVTAGLYFGGFQALMPVIGWLLGRQFESLIKSVDHWIAFALLALIGANMIRESFKKDDENVNGSFTPRVMLPLAVATSIDALAVGVVFAFEEVKIVPAVLIIGAVTFALSVIGVVIGNRFGAKYNKRAEIAGGVILILLGGKILLEGLGVF
jgi:putative Mn2+ efflux pump MntP